jgi:streptogramin lyase
MCVSRIRYGVSIITTFMLLGLVSCASVTVPQVNQPEQDLQWPALGPRIAWMKTIRDYQDASIDKGFWKRLSEFFTGEEDTRIGKPYGVIFDEQQRLFIADVGQARVHFMDQKEKRYSIIGEGAFRSPIGLTQDDEENLYITDSGAGAIYRYNLRKLILEPFIVSDLGRPTGIAFNKSNRLLYVTRTTEHQIAVFDLRGNERFRIGSRGDGPRQFNYPTDLFVDRRGQLYVTDALNSRISIFSAEGAHLKTFGQPGDSIGSFAKPKGIAVDSHGHIYVCDALFDAVQVFNSEGELLLSFGSNGTQNGQFWMPAGIHIDREDTIYVADSFNRRVQVFKYINAPDTSPDNDL